MKWLNLLRYNTDDDTWFLYELERKKIGDIIKYNEKHCCELDIQIHNLKLRNLKICYNLLDIFLRYNNTDYNNKQVNYKNSNLYNLFTEEKIVNAYNKEELNQIIFENKAFVLYNKMRINYLCPHI
ncbi:MAG: hypothetical protein RSC92_04290 [Clostridia bacterium]